MARKKKIITKINLTSLMDVFTILVFFLLVNSGTPETLETPKQITLPESNLQTKPRETVVIFVSPDEVIVQGEVVATLDEILESRTRDVEGITAQLTNDNIFYPIIFGICKKTSSLFFIIVSPFFSYCTC